MGANIWALGATSLLTDISSEMVTSVLPLYIVLHMQMSPLAFGAADGLYQGVAAVVRGASGIVADRLQHHKAVAVLGYGISAVAKLGYVVAGTLWPAFLGVISADRLGKGIRTAPRDALIAVNAVPGEIATAFGVHRAMDAAGAAVGPLVAFAVLSIAPGRFDQVFVASFSVALVGVAALVLFVNASVEETAPSRTGPLTSSRVLESVAAPGFRAVLAAACALSVATVSDALLYLVLQRQHTFDPARITLLFVGTPLCYFALAGPLGILADRYGPRRMFVAGHVSLLLVYALLWQACTGAVAVGACLLLLGGYYAATDGILAAMASTVLPADTRATGLGVLATCATAARAGATLAFSALWTYHGSGLALAVFAVALAAAMVFAQHQLRHPWPQVSSRDGAP